MPVRPPTALLVPALLAGCGPSSTSPEGVATRFLHAQLRGQTADQVALVTDADRAAADRAPNDTNATLHPEPDDLPLLEAAAKRSTLGKPTAVVDGDHATVSVPGQSPDVNLGSVLLSLLGSSGDEAGMKQKLLDHIAEAPLKENPQTVSLVKEGGAWRVDTEWAEKAEARRVADAAAAKAAAQKKIKDDYESGVREDFRRAQGALRQLVSANPNDTGWKEEFDAINTLVPLLSEFTVNVRSQGIYQGEYRITAGVKNGTALPLKRFTLRYTFLNGDTPVGSPAYESFHSASFFSTRVLDPGGATSAESSGTPPDGWTGQRVRAEVTAFEVDGE